MNEGIAIGSVLTGIIILAVFIIVRLFKRKTTVEISQLDLDIHKSIGKLEMLLGELKDANKEFDINGKKDKP